METHYQGGHDSLEAWAAQFLEDSGSLAEVPESLRGYIDFEAWARDAELGGDVFTVEVDGVVHVFWSR
jgi:antirestriction protein